ncbi:response regulator transcription factor [Pelosinus sp. UFO1]|uniref:response regulator transcription factor n=1 Tax=Pelosinus sp. UFO1 TaxID=484770 RepID=UPI0004D0DF65|nr:response regulator transcription factor [Pelosinus sp. UFO1]AIF53162.1 two component transcriptional regulator, winged helix family [Pelosinus sp. UFO1]
MKILVIEDDNVLREAVVALLLEENYIVDEASTGDLGLYAAEQCIHDLLVLDIMLPEVNGLEIVSALRAKGCPVPILLLTARDSVDDRVIGLDAGADDYLVKPFAIRELLARIKALMRRKGNLVTEGDLSYGGISLNSKVRDGFAGKQPFGLGSKEYDILEFLILNKEQILTRDQIFDRIWGYDSEAAISVVDLYIHYLRKKLAPYGFDMLIQTVRGTGFILREK